MSLFTNLYISFFPVSIIFLNSANAARFGVRNNCPYTVWAAAVPGGGRRLNQGEMWALDVPAGTTGGRIWARTGCQFNASGMGRCTTGDCWGLLQCQDYGTPPNTLAEFALSQFNNMDFIDLSLLDGFNVPMEFSSTSGNSFGENQTWNLLIPGRESVSVDHVPFFNCLSTLDRCNQVIRCTADIVGQCPDELKIDGGCNGACRVFKTDEYCCNSSGSCGPTNYSRFFKDRCPDAYSYPRDDASSTFTCPGGTNYKVVFCP
ncbi:protein P21-like [Punica granatum]|uniref:Protein P21-like n=1 Tax=Punica granatum TaxID=22663 RepID=A0A6P8DBF0_PUNGR|nr:protein P21-like [Punica granatum]